MNPFREDASPGVNKTEVECAKIREHEETKRKRIEEREKTRRERGDSWVVPWLVSGAVLIAAVIAASISYTSHLDAQYPHRSCVETVEVVSISVSARSCSNGGWFESTPTSKPGEVLVRCRCDARPASSSSGGTTETKIDVQRAP